MKINKLSRIALFTAVLCVISPFTLPFGSIALSLSSLGVYIAALLLPGFSSIYAVSAYILTGMFGMPVFSGFQGGAGVVLGPAGGFILGYLLCAFVISLLKTKNKLFSLALGTAVLYISGLLWYAFVTDTGILQSLFISVLPFIPVDAVKIFAAYTLSGKIQGSKAG